MAGFDNDVVYGVNVDFTGTSPVSGQINLNGELLVGSTTAPFIRAYVPTGSSGVSIAKGPGTIDFSLANVPNSSLSNSSITISPGTGLSGGGSVSLGSNVSLALTSPVVVANGGTGVATFSNTSSLLATGTSSTGALQNIASVATGQVLTSAGTSTIPAWSAAPTVTSITFGAGTALSVYTEGTWTPTIVGTSTAGTSTYTAQNGYYTKIGNLVTLIGVVAVSGQTGTGNIQTGAFPFTIKNQTNGNPIGPLDFSGSGYTWTAGYTYFTLQGNTNATTANPILNGSTKGAGAFAIANTALTLDYNICFQV